jgi:hypothetical protein
MAGKERSPNYPALSLGAAIEAVKKVYEKERRTPVSTELIGQAMGHPKLSGSALTKIGALRQYGLLENVGRGKAKVSDDALTILLRKPEDREYAEALRHLALKPELFSDLYKGFEGASDDALRYHLVRERQFSEEGAGRVIKAYRDTIAFAKLAADRYNDSQDDASDDDDEHPTRETDAQSGASRSSRFAIREQKREVDVAYSWPLGNGNKAELGFVSEPTQAQLDVLLAQLQIMRQVAPTEAAKNEPEGDEG